MNLRTARSVQDFVGPEGETETVAGMWESGESRPEWSFILEDGGHRLGRIAYRVEDTCQPEFLGDLPPRELYVYGWEMSWNDTVPEAGRALVGESIRRLPDTLPELVQVRLNAEFHSHIPTRLEIIEAVGFELFQEKEGVLWEDDGVPVQVPDRLRFPSVSEVGREPYRAVLGSTGRGTLDRNDRYYYELAGEENWSNVFMSFVEDQDMWLLGVLEDGTPVGFVAVSAFEEPDTATITFIGVHPDHRGRGYINDLLLAGTAAAQRRGFRSILSDVDTLNAPMLAAMERNGHHADRHPWHVWHYRMPR
jgi:RimJ/RimL family protein N-acetyltransferase